MPNKRRASETGRLWRPLGSGGWIPWNKFGLESAWVKVGWKVEKLVFRLVGGRWGCWDFYKNQNQVILLVTFFGTVNSRDPNLQVVLSDQPNDRGSRSVTAAESPAIHLFPIDQSINQSTNQPTNRSINWEVGNRSPKIHIFWSTRAWSPNPDDPMFFVKAGDEAGNTRSYG